VLLRWCLQHDLPVISKSTHRERIRQNAQIFDFALPNEDMAELDALDQTNAPTAPSSVSGGEERPRSGLRRRALVSSRQARDEPR